MTREEAIIEMQRMKKSYCNTHTDVQLKKDSKIIDALNMGIKALEQESVLDKIRAEIEAMTPTYHNNDWSITDLVPISEVLKVVDKYKTESEVSNE